MLIEREATHAPQLVCLDYESPGRLRWEPHDRRIGIPPDDVRCALPVAFINLTELEPMPALADVIVIHPVFETACQAQRSSRVTVIEPVPPRDGNDVNTGKIE